jgi:hypothetical protein
MEQERGNMQTMENRSQLSGVVGRAYVSRNRNGFLYDQERQINE